MDMAPKRGGGNNRDRRECESSTRADEAACVSEGGRRVRLLGGEDGGRCGEFCMLK